MENSATINTVVTEGGTINTTVETGTTIQSTLTGGGIGATGGDGPPGTPGSVWHEANGTPTTTYANGDYYLNTANGDVYVQTNGAWGSPVGNIKGPAGPEGSFPYQNVSDYGAVGDNTTDDTASIQNAIDAASLHGGTVFFPTPPVAYKITSALILYTGVSLLGTGSEATQINQTSTTADGVDANDAASMSIQGIYLNGPGSGTGVGINMGWTDAGNVPYLDFRDVKVYNWGSDGIAIETPIVSNFTQVVCKSNGGYGLNFYHAGTSCTFDDCWMRENAFAGYHFYESVYMSLNGCASDSNGVGYLVENAQSIAFSGCGCESTVASGGDWDGTAFKISNSSVIGLHNVWVTANNAIGIWITNGSIACEVFGAADNTPGGSATAFVQTDESTNTTVSDVHNTTANSYSAGTITILNDGANGLTSRYLYAKGASGTLALTADTNGAAFNLFADTTGVLGIFGSGGQTLNVELMDGYLQLDPLTATTVPYLDANKRFVSSAITPTQLGYLSSGTGVTGSGALMFGTSPTASSLTVNTLLTANTQISLVGTSGTLEFTAATDGGDFNILSTATGAKTLAIYGSSSNILHLDLLDGNLYMNTVEVLSNAGVLTAPLTALGAITGSPSSTTFLRGDGTWGTPAGTGMANPMTTTGDMIYSSSGTTPARLAVGGSTAVLMGGTTPAWTTTPAFGVITATSLNKVTITAPGTSATLTLITGSTLATAGAFSLTLTSTATTVATFPSGTITLVGTAATQTLTGKTITGLILTAGSTTVAPLTFSGVGALLTTAVINTVEWDGTNLYYTNAGPTRHTVANRDSAQTFTGVQTFSSAPSFAVLPTGAGVSSTEAASTLVARDANGNAAVTNLQQGYTSTATATGTTTLTVASNQNQVFTGTLGQICVLPAVSTLTLGTDYVITNLSTGSITIQSSGANTIVVLAPGQIATLVSNATSGTGAAVWNVGVANGVYDTRNNNGTNATEINSVIETGWVTGVIGAAAHIEIAVTFGHTYASAPIVVPAFGGDNASLSTYGSGGNNIKGPVACKATDITTTGCNIWIHSSDGTSWSAGNTVFAQFLVVGV